MEEVIVDLWLVAKLQPHLAKEDGEREGEMDGGGRGGTEDGREVGRERGRETQGGGGAA